MNDTVERFDEFESSIKSCLLWIPKGFAKQNPIVVDEDIENENLTVKTAQDVNSNANEGSNSEFEKNFNFTNYDDENIEGAFLNSSIEESLNTKDEYLKDNTHSDSESDFDFEIGPNEYCLVVGSIENDVEYEIETYTYDDNEGQTYLHHSISLPEKPLTICSLPHFGSNERKNYLAVNGVGSAIHIYDNDKIGAYSNDFELNHNEINLEESVTVLKNEDHLLYSGYSDGSIVVWDIIKAKSILSFIKVSTSPIVACAVSGNIALFSNEFGDIFCVSDHKHLVKTISINQTIDSIILAKTPQHCYFSSKDGELTYFNFVNGTKVFSKSIVDGEILCIVEMKKLPLLVACCSAGEIVILLTNEIPHRTLLTKKFNHGPIYDCALNMDNELLIAFSANQLILWDMSTEPILQSLIKQIFA